MSIVRYGIAHYSGFYIDTEARESDHHHHQHHRHLRLMPFMYRAGNQSRDLLPLSNFLGSLSGLFVRSFTPYLNLKVFLDQKKPTFLGLLFDFLI